MMDLVMNRSSNGLRWESRHPFTGKFYGNFCRAKVWFGEPKTIYVNQFLTTGIPLIVQDFNFQDPDFVIDPKNPKYEEIDKEVYRVRFSIRDPDEATSAIRDHVQNPGNIRSSIHHYLQTLRVRHANQILSTDIYELCFTHAMQWAFSPEAAHVSFPRPATLCR
jgi:hypothetical protein